MRKIHSNVILFLAALTALVLLAAGLIFYDGQSRKIQDLTLESQSLLVEWNELQNETYQILLDRYTVTGSETPARLEIWQGDFTEFSDALDRLVQEPQLKRLPGIPEKLASIVRVWRYTKVQLNNAHHHFVEIVKSGLGEKVMVNGFLHTLYKLRIDGQLAVSDIFLLDDTIYALETLDEVSKEFDTLFSAVIDDMNVAAQQYLRRVRIFSAGLFFFIIVIVGLYSLLNRQYRISQSNRSRALEAEKDGLLKRLVEDSREENLVYFSSRKSELDIHLDIGRTIVPIALQIDAYGEFSHHHNIREQKQIIRNLRNTVSELVEEENLVHEIFRYSDDTLILLLNLEDEDEDQTEELKDRIGILHRRILEEFDFSVTLSLGDACTDAIDLDQEFSDLLLIVEYRYLAGIGSYLYRGSSYLTVFDEFQYPHEKEKQFEDALKTLNAEEAVKKMNDLIGDAYHYSPQNMKRLVLRLTANLSSHIEFMEKVHHIRAIDRMTPVILKIQNLETIEDVCRHLTEIINEVIKRCREKKEDRHDQTVEKIRAFIVENIDDFGLSAEMIADEIHLTASYVNRLFKDHTALSIAGYVNRERLLRAERYLRTTDYTIGEIAERSGFSSLGTFFRLFKKKYGRSPRDYQKEVLMIMG